MEEILELLKYKKAELDNMYTLEVVWDPDFDEGVWEFKVAVLKLEIKDLQDLL